MSKSTTQKVRITNMPTTLLGTVFLWWVICAIMVMSGCDGCKGLKSGVACMGKDARDLRTEFLSGYESK